MATSAVSSANLNFSNFCTQSRSFAATSSYSPSISMTTSPSSAAVGEEDDLNISPVRSERRLFHLIGRKLDVLNKRQDRMEVTMKRVESKLDRVIRLMESRPAISPSHPSSHIHDEDGDMMPSLILQDLPASNTTAASAEDFNDIPVQWRYSIDELRRMNSDSTGPGNFAKNICIKLYPELFGSENLRLKYSYFGGRVLAKKELDQTRKNVLERYVLYFHPEMKDKELWKDRVVPKVNEFLPKKGKTSVTIVTDLMFTFYDD